MRNIVVDAFCLRQWSDKAPVIPMAVEDFEQRVNELYSETALVDGYAPFCKHLFTRNFAGCKSNIVEITTDNEKLLKSAYVARTDKELPVLTRWFEGLQLKEAKYLDIILYSREQIKKENEAQGVASTETAPWGVVSVKAQDVDYELPMTPITMMRNALGKEQGGSGVPLDEDKYQASVAFWEKHAVVNI